MQFLHMKLDGPEDKLTCEPGSMSYMSDDVKGGVDCGAPIKRACGGQPCIMSTYEGRHKCCTYDGIFQNDHQEDNS